MYDNPCMAGTPEPIIILDGDLASLVALACASDEAVSIGTGRTPGPCAIAWLPNMFGDSQRDRSSACDRQIALYNARRLAKSEIDDAFVVPMDRPAETTMLFAALAHARAQGSPRVIWPAHPGRPEDETAIDLDLASSIIDRSLLVEQLARLDSGTDVPGVSVETPHADLTDRQLVELAADLAVPVKTLWWWGGQSDEAHRQRDRWLGRFRETGLWKPAETVTTGRA